MSLLLGVLVSLLLVVPASAAEADPVYELSEPVVFSAPPSPTYSVSDLLPFIGLLFLGGVLVVCFMKK